MEVFTVSVGIGRVAISVCQTRQVVSRLHYSHICRNCWRSALHRVRSTPSGLTPLCRGAGTLRPSGPYLYGPIVFKLTGPARLADLTPLRRRTGTGPPRTAYPRIRGCYLSLSELSRRSILSPPTDLRPPPPSTGCANLAPLCQTGELLQYQPGI
jgi:hypothetical protein